MDAFVERPTFAARSSAALDRVENLYLKVLRAGLLAAATILLFCALGWATLSLIKVLKSPDSVIEKPSIVDSSEIIQQDQNASRQIFDSNADSLETASKRSYYDGFVKRYFALYKSFYQTSLRKDDKRLTMGEFDDLTINSAARLRAVKNGELQFDIDKGDLEAFLPIITDASSSQATKDRLEKYRNARKRNVSTQVRRTRVETRRGWDSYSTTCDEWYTSPIGCAVNRRVEMPFTARINVMRYPDGILSPNEILKGYQDKYFSLLSDRRDSNSSQANREREDIIVGQISGWNGLSQSVVIVGAFLVLMFFFLLVAIERHQRKLVSVDDALH